MEFKGKPLISPFWFEWIRFFVERKEEDFLGPFDFVFFRFNSFNSVVRWDLIEDLSLRNSLWEFWKFIWKIIDDGKRLDISDEIIYVILFYIISCFRKICMRDERKKNWLAGTRVLFLNLIREENYFLKIQTLPRISIIQRTISREYYARYGNN